jgi:ubiquinone/menaquinone biosynthesis C-methylase UbiE
MSASNSMQFISPIPQSVIDEIDVIDRMLSLKGTHILELGCGAAEKTRMIANRSGVEKITAVEIDPIQHQKNLKITDMPNVEFKSYGAQEIPEPDDAFDVVVMFKSLHHVPEASMDQALLEIRRVLKPGGMAYFSEPVFDGEFNEIIRLFHDEELVRTQAFNALGRAIKADMFSLKEEFFFDNIVKMLSFEQFEAGVLKATFMDHKLDEALLAEVKQRFMAHESDNGFVFRVPNRVDLLVKHPG